MSSHPYPSYRQAAGGLEDFEPTCGVAQIVWSCGAVLRHPRPKLYAGQTARSNTSLKNGPLGRITAIPAMWFGPRSREVRRGESRSEMQKLQAAGETRGLDYPHFFTRRQRGERAQRRLNIGTRHSAFPAGRKSEAILYDSSYRQENRLRIILTKHLGSGVALGRDRWGKRHGHRVAGRRGQRPRPTRTLNVYENTGCYRFFGVFRRPAGRLRTLKIKGWHRFIIGYRNDKKKGC